MNKSHKKGVILLICTAILWSMGGMFIKGVTWNGVSVAGARGIVAALTLLCFMGKPSLKFTWPKIGAIIAYAGTSLIFVMATKQTTAANAILLQYTAPIYTAILGAVLLKEKVHKKDIICIGIILGGMILFFIDGLSIGNITGDLLALLAGVCFGCMHVFMRMEKDNNPIEAMFWGNILVFVIALPWMGDITFTPINIGSILFLGIVQMGLSYFLYSRAIQHVTALEAVLIPIIEPILNPIWVFMVQGEMPSIWSIVGGIIVIVGVTVRGIPSPLKHNKQLNNQETNLD